MLYREDHFSGYRKGSYALPPVIAGSSTSRSSKRAMTSVDIQRKDIRKITPKILIESKRRHRRKTKDQNRTQYVRTSGFATPQHQFGNFETVKGKLF